MSQEEFTWLAIVEARDRLSDVYQRIARTIEEFDSVVKKASDDSVVAGAKIDEGLTAASVGADELKDASDRLADAHDRVALATEAQAAADEELALVNAELHEAIERNTLAMSEQTAAVDALTVAVGENTVANDRNENSQKKVGKAAKDAGAEVNWMSTVIALAGPALIPIFASLTVAAAGLATTLAGAGVATLGFGLALKGQLGDVSAASTAYANYTKAVSEFGQNSKQAAAALKTYDQQIKGMPPASIAASKALTGLKDQFAAWSGSLAGSTMPVFVKAIQILEKLLPILTPMVKSAAVYFSRLEDLISADIKTDHFKELVKEFQDFADKSLGKVIDGIQQLVEWMAKIGESQGMKDFISMGKKDLPGVTEMFRNIADFIGKFLKAAQGFGGIDLRALEMLAEALNHIPQSVLNELVPFILAVVAAIKIWTIAQWALDAALDANPISLVVIAIAGLVAAFIYLWNNCKGFRDFWIDAWHDIVGVVETVFDWIKGHWREIIVVILGPMGVVIALVTKYWHDIVQLFKDAVQWVKDALSWFGQLGHDFNQWLNDAGKAVTQGINAIVKFFKDLPGTILKLLSSAGTWLYQTGVNIVHGLITGIKAMMGDLTAVGAQIGDVATKAVQAALKSHSPSQRMADEVGATIPSGVAMGILDNLGILQGAAAKMGQAAIASATGGLSLSLRGGLSGTGFGSSLPVTNAGGTGGGTYIDFRGSTMMTERDMSVLAQKLGMALGTDILPAGGLRVAM